MGILLLGRTVKQKQKKGTTAGSMNCTMPCGMAFLLNLVR